MSDKLTPKQEGFVNDYLDSGNATEAALKNYNTEDPVVAASIGWENLRKPQIMAQIQDASNIAFSSILELSRNAENESVKLNASKDILDRAGFKATDKTDVTSGGQPINISISKDIAEKNDL